MRKTSNDGIIIRGMAGGMPRKWVGWLGKLWKNVQDVLFPRTCPMCDNILERGANICTECRGRLRYIEEPRCMKCGKQLAKEEYEYCYDCAKVQHLYKTGLGVFRYDAMVSKSIYRFKYYNRRSYAEFYGEAIVKYYGRLIKGWNADVLIPVPIHKHKLQKRGYNQAELIAMELGKGLNIPVDGRCLRRVRHTKAQKELNRSERKKNLENAFKISADVVKYKKIILVDDIYTTGSTIDECAKVLISAGAYEVYFISLSIGAGI